MKTLSNGIIRVNPTFFAVCQTNCGPSWDAPMKTIIAVWRKIKKKVFRVAHPFNGLLPWCAAQPEWDRLLASPWDRTLSSGSDAWMLLILVNHACFKFIRQWVYSDIRHHCCKFETHELRKDRLNNEEIAKLHDEYHSCKDFEDVLAGSFHIKLVVTMLFPNLLEKINNQKKLSTFVEACFFEKGRTKLDDIIRVLNSIVVAFGVCKQCHHDVWQMGWQEFFAEELRRANYIFDANSNSWWHVDTKSGRWTKVAEFPELAWKGKWVVSDKFEKHVRQSSSTAKNNGSQSCWKPPLIAVAKMIAARILIAVSQGRLLLRFRLKFDWL